MDTFEKTIFTKLNKNNKYFSEIIVNVKKIVDSKIK